MSVYKQMYLLMRTGARRLGHRSSLHPVVVEEGKGHLNCVSATVIVAENVDGHKRTYPLVRMVNNWARRSSLPGCHRDLCFEICLLINVLKSGKTNAVVSMRSTMSRIYLALAGRGRNDEPWGY